MLAFLTSPVTGWGMAAAIIAVTNEYLYRKYTGGWFQMAHVYVPAQLMISYTLYRLITIPGVSLIDAFIVFSFSTVAFRVFVSIVLLHDNIGTGSWVALGLLFLARVAQLTLGK